MADLPHVIGLLHRADWTRLSLSAELRSENDRELSRLSSEPWSCWDHGWPEQKQDDGRYAWRGALLIGPGGRWRLDCPVPGRGTAGQAAEGNDGERGWSWRPEGTGFPAPLPVKVDGAYLPVHELFCPSGLLGGYTLEELGPVTVAGRDAIAVAATPRRDVLRSVPGRIFRDRISHDRIEVAVDAELGILLRRIETSGGKLVTLTELTDLTMNPPEAADPVRFAPPPGSNRSEDPAAGPPKWCTGPVETNAISLAMGALGALIRYAPHRPGHGPAGQDPAAMMPSPDPAPLVPGDDISPPDEVLDLLYRGGEPRDLGATVRQWDDQAALSERVSEDIRAAGPPGGVGYYFDAVARYQTVTLTVARLRVSRPDRYRLEYSSRPDGFVPLIAACDGERRWRVVQDRIVVGPAAPLQDYSAFLADSCWLLRGRLSGGQEITYRGRPARQLRVTPVPGLEKMVLWPLTMYPTDAIVDAETGCLLRLISYAGDTLARWLELDDISTEPADPDEFQVHVPPGTRTVEETGDLITDSLATMPGPTGTAFRVAAETVTRTTAAVSAARSFLDDLRGHR